MFSHFKILINLVHGNQTRVNSAKWLLCSSCLSVEKKPKKLRSINKWLQSSGGRKLRTNTSIIRWNYFWLITWSQKTALSWCHSQNLGYQGLQTFRYTMAFRVLTTERFSDKKSKLKEIFATYLHSLGRSQYPWSEWHPGRQIAAKKAKGTVKTNARHLFETHHA